MREHRFGHLGTIDTDKEEEPGRPQGTKDDNASVDGDDGDGGKKKKKTPISCQLLPVLFTLTAVAAEVRHAGGVLKLRGGAEHRVAAAAAAAERRGGKVEGKKKKWKCELSFFSFFSFDLDSHTFSSPKTAAAFPLPQPTKRPQYCFERMTKPCPKQGRLDSDLPEDFSKS